MQIQKVVVACKFFFLFYTEVMHKRILLLFETFLEKALSRAKSINFTIEKNTPTVFYSELMQADTAIGTPPDFKVNTPLKSHQSKIESLTVARELFYIQSNNGHGHYARCVHTPYVNKDGNMTKISRIAVTGVARAGRRDAWLGRSASRQW